MTNRPIKEERMILGPGGEWFTYTGDTVPEELEIQHALTQLVNTGEAVVLDPFEEDPEKMRYRLANSEERQRFRLRERISPRLLADCLDLEYSGDPARLLDGAGGGGTEDAPQGSPSVSPASHPRGSAQAKERG